MFTCNKCETKQSKFFTKKAYHQGVVLIRCDGCHAVHLISDNLGWYGDDSTNIEDIMKKKGQEVVHGLADEGLLKNLNEKVKKTRERLRIEQEELKGKREEIDREEEEEEEEAGRK